MAAMTPQEKTRENRLRRAAERQGIEFLKSRQRDPRGIDYGRYWLKRDGVEVLTTQSVDEVERFLLG